MTIGTVFFQMLSLAILILVGVVISRIKMVDSHGMGQISRLINYVFNPMMMVSSAISSVGSIDKQVMLLLFGLAAALYLALILIGHFAAPLFDKRPGQKEMYQLMFIFSNVGFMGIPVIRGVFGAENVVYVLAFVFVFNIVFYTYGVALLDGGLSGESLKKMLNPGTVSSVATLLIVLLEPQVPEFLSNVVDYLGSAASPLAMIAVGVTLANADLKAVFLNPKTYLFTLVKMVAIPLIAIPLLKLLPFSDTVIGVCLVEIAMPVANLPLILGTEKGIDCTSCSASIIMTTLASVLTVPLLVALI